MPVYGPIKPLAMEHFLVKATKELKIGFQETLRFVGLREDSDDPEYTARAATLDQIEARYSLVQRGLAVYWREVQEAALSIDAAHNILKDPDAAPGGVAGLTAAHLQGPLQRCAVPLAQFAERLRALRALQRKRGRNRALLPAGAGAAPGARAQKYGRYHAAFVRGVDALAAVAAPIFDQLFAQQQWALREYARALRADLERHPPPPPARAPDRDARPVAGQ
jgi:hypothetical protein